LFNFQGPVRPAQPFCEVLCFERSYIISNIPSFVNTFLKNFLFFVKSRVLGRKKAVDTWFFLCGFFHNRL